jgi:uncharacterized RDD family membrane protein YckC
LVAEENLDRSSSRPRAGVVLSLDNVAVHLPVARAGSRAVSASVDYLLWLLMMLVWTLLTIGLALSLGGGVTWMLGLYFLGLFVIDWAFFALQEVLMNGQTVGKRLAGLRVVSHDGSRASTPQLLIRNLVRTLDLVFAIPLLILDREGRRLGDHLARTRVVHLDRQSSAIGVRRIPAGWTSERVAVVENLLSRATSLDTDRATILAERVLAVVASDDPAFLEGIPEILDPLTRLRGAFGVERLNVS